MKKIVLATALLVALGASSFANGNENYKKLFNDFTNAFKNASNIQSPVHWSNTDNYRKATFLFNNESVSAYFDSKDDGLIGFSRSIAVNDLPVEGLTNIQKKYEDWTIKEAAMFLYADGSVFYYVGVNKGKSNVVLSMTTKGKVGIFGKMD